MSLFAALSSRTIGAVRSYRTAPRRRSLVAVALGGILGATVLYLIGPGAQGVAAQNFGWVLLGYQPEGRLAAQPGVVAAAAAPAARRSRRTERWRMARRQPMHLARRAVCVRLCDGYAFPVGNYYDVSDRKKDEDVCASTFPNLQTRLFVMPRGSESLRDAVAVEGGAGYAALPAAFAYLKAVDQAPSCHQTFAAKRWPAPLQDFSLRRGDIVVTSQGFRVFRGVPGVSHRASDFLSLAQSGSFKGRVRHELMAMEEVSTYSSLRTSPPVHVSAGPQKPQLVAARQNQQSSLWGEPRAAHGFEALN
jgi:hypothetical protein